MGCCGKNGCAQSDARREQRRELHAAAAVVVVVVVVVAAVGAFGDFGVQLRVSTCCGVSQFSASSCDVSFATIHPDHAVHALLPALHVVVARARS